MFRKIGSAGRCAVAAVVVAGFASHPTVAGAQVPQTASFRVVSSRPDAQGPTLKAVWLDREAGVKLCEHCYGRGVREDAREDGLV